MGLDQYARSVDSKYVTSPVDFDTSEIPPDENREIHYWRKHPNLQGWMERLYRQKGGNDDVFNCVPVALDLADLDALEKDVVANALPETTGFFFGQSTEEDRIDDLKFIQKARTELALGRAVYYYSWW